MTESDELPPIAIGSFAWFFDVDGTLARIEKRPEMVSIPAEIIQALGVISDATGGALALVSGRPLTELDALSKPLHCPAAGVHGAERRNTQGEISRIELSPSLAARLESELTDALKKFPGALLESKGMAFALHYRQAEQYQDAILDLAANFTARHPELTLQPGKCVVELKPAGVDKGAAIKVFMQEAPFVGRTPLFIGDDLTDEAGFKQVNDLSGISIKVGAGETKARYRIGNVEQVHHWLLSLIKQQEHYSIKSKSAIGEDL